MTSNIWCADPNINGFLIKTFCGTGNGWCAASAGTNHWIQADLTTPMYITAVITQGRQNFDQWVTEYQVAYSDDGQTWQHMANSNGTPITVSHDGICIVQSVVKCRL